MHTFALGESTGHRAGDPGCPACADLYPARCRCNGLMHAAQSSEVDADGNPMLVTTCDVCARSEDQLDEV